MNLDDVISKLQEFRAVYGDIPVFVGYDSCAYSYLDYIECKEEEALDYYKDIIETVTSKGIRACLCRCKKGYFIMREISSKEVFMNEHYMDIPVSKTGLGRIKYEYTIIKEWK